MNTASLDKLAEDINDLHAAQMESRLRVIAGVCTMWGICKSAKEFWREVDSIGIERSEVRAMLKSGGAV